MGPLPPLHRLLTAVLILMLCLGTGIWLAGFLELPVRGIGVGLGAGVLLVWLATHDFHRHDPRAVRVTRRR